MTVWHETRTHRKTAHSLFSAQVSIPHILFPFFVKTHKSMQSWDRAWNLIWKVDCDIQSRVYCGGAKCPKQGVREKVRRNLRGQRPLIKYLLLWRQEASESLLIPEAHIWWHLMEKGNKVRRGSAWPWQRQWNCNDNGNGNGYGYVMASQVQDVEQPYLFPIETKQMLIDVCVM